MVFLTIGLSLIILIPLFLWFVLNLNAPELTKSEKQTIPAPFLWCIASFFTLFVGGLSQILLALPLTGSYLKGSYYEMASEHYLWIGVLMAFLTGLYFWWSKFFGKTMDEEKSISRCIKVFFSVHVMGLSASLLGFAGQPVATSNYPGALALLQIVLTLSVIVLAFNIFGIVFDFIGSLKKKEEADINPYESLSFEWSLPSPPQLESDPKTGNGDPYGY